MLNKENMKLCVPNHLSVFSAPPRFPIYREGMPGLRPGEFVQIDVAAGEDDANLVFRFHLNLAFK